MKKKQTMELAAPATEHTLEDRRGLTQDALKVAEHSLKQTFSDRVKAVREEIDKVCAEALPHCIAYNEAVAVIALDLKTEMLADLRYSFDRINALKLPGADDEEYDEDADDDDDTKLTLSVNVPFGLNFIFVPYDAAFKKFVKKYEGIGFGYLSDGVRSLSARDLVGKQYGYDEEGSAAHDLRLHIEVEIENKIEEMSMRRVVDVTCSSELMAARTAIGDCVARIETLQEDLKKAEIDLSKLPSMIKELDVSATVMRISEAGGADFLSKIIKGVELITAGNTDLTSAQLLGMQEDEK